METSQERSVTGVVSQRGRTRRQVREGALGIAALAGALQRRLAHLGEAKVGELECAGERAKDVVRLDVAVDSREAVQVRQRVRRLASQAHLHRGR